MQIGVISDTHDKQATIDLALQYFQEQKVSLVIHCGDWKSLETARYFAKKASEYALPVRGVLGNNDLDTAGFIELGRTAPGDFQLYEGIFEMPLASHGLLAAYHGHHKPTLRKVLADDRYRAICLGHSHKPLIDDTGGKLIVNPGSTAFSIPRQKSWRPSVAIIDTSQLVAHITFVN